MAFKFIFFAAAALSAASAGLVNEGYSTYGGGLGVAYSAAPAVSHVYNNYGLASLDDHLSVGVSDQNIIRTHGGTVSQISKKVVSPTSYVTKSDTRINNAGYKTLAYAQPSYYAQPALGYSQKVIAQPALAYAAQPAISYAAPLVQKSYISQPAISYAAAAPLVQKSYISQPALSYAQPLGYAQAHGYSAGYAQPALGYSQKVIAQPALAYAAQPALAYAAQPALAYGAKSYAQSYGHVSYDSPIAHYAW